MGEFEIMMREDLVPITVNNFVSLTNEYFYDGLIFHRVVAGFVVQDGDPTGTGSCGPGYTIPDEYNEEIQFDTPGVIGMAKTSAPNSAGSQYFITVAPTPHLNGNYAAFGNVIEGMDVVMDINGVETTGANSNPPNKPIVDVVIDSVRIMTPQLNAFTPQMHDIEVEIGEEIVFGVFYNEPNLTHEWYINNEIQDETFYIMPCSFSTSEVYEVKSITYNQGYSYQVVWTVNVNNTSIDDSVEPNQTVFAYSYPNPFNISANERSSEVKIFFSNLESGNIKVSIFNLKGQIIKSITDKYYNKGHHTVVWNGTDNNGRFAATGIYFYKIETDNKIISGKIILAK